MERQFRLVKKKICQNVQKNSISRSAWRGSWNAIVKVYDSFVLLLSLFRRVQQHNRSKLIIDYVWVTFDLEECASFATTPLSMRTCLRWRRFYRQRVMTGPPNWCRNGSCNFHAACSGAPFSIIVLSHELHFCATAHLPKQNVRTADTDSTGEVPPTRENLYIYTY